MTETNSESPFGYPISFEDKKWKWRENLQQKVMTNEHSVHVMNKLKYANTYKTNTNNKLKTIRKSSILKFGCPLHDLKPALHETNYECPSLVMCNGYSQNCDNLFIDKQRLVKCGEWTFHDLHITSDNISLIKTPLVIQLISNYNVNCNFNTDNKVNNLNKNWDVNNDNNNNGDDINDENKNKSNKNNDNNIHINNHNNGIISTIIPINILRTNEATFEKRFRPGFYRYDGKPFNENNENENNINNASNKMGTWFFGKLFYVRKNDVVLLPLIENQIYLQILLHSDDCNKKRDSLYDIIGGVGLCMLARHRNDGIHNCIMLRSNDDNINNVLKKSKIIIYKYDNISNNNVNVYINNNLLNLSTIHPMQTLLEVSNILMDNNNNANNCVVAKNVTTRKKKYNKHNNKNDNCNENKDNDCNKHNLNFQIKPITQEFENNDDSMLLPPECKIHPNDENLLLSNPFSQQTPNNNHNNNFLDCPQPSYFNNHMNTAYYKNMIDNFNNLFSQDSMQSNISNWRY